MRGKSNFFWGVHDRDKLANIRGGGGGGETEIRLGSSRSAIRTRESEKTILLVCSCYIASSPGSPRAPTASDGKLGGAWERG